MKIQKATEHDTETIASFGNKVLAHHQKFDSFYQPVATPATASLEVEKLAFIAYDDNESPVGYIQGIFNSQPKDRSIPFAVIQSVWVEEDSRGNGIARQLVELFESTAKSMGAKQIDLFVDVRNTEALSLWNQSGYETYQERRRKLI